MRWVSCSVFFPSRRRHTRSKRDWSSDVCSSELGVALARHRRHEVALGVDHGQCRPSSGGVGLPGDEVGVVEDEVFDLVALHGLVDGLDRAFELELRGVDADDDELLGIPLLERAQLVAYMTAIYSPLTT